MDETLQSLEEEVKKFEKEESSKSNVNDTFQMLLEKGLNKELGKGKKRRKKRDKESKHLAPPHSESDCFEIEVEEKREGKEEVDEWEFDEWEFEDERPLKRRRKLFLQGEAKRWSNSRRILWLASNPSLE